MSRENVEIVRRSYEALNRRDLHAVLDRADPELVATSRVAAAEGTVYRGRDGLRRMLEDILSVFPDWAPQVLDARDLGDTVLTQIRMRGRAVESGITLEEVGWQVIEFRDGKIVRMHGYGSEAEALEAVGLSE